MKAKFQIKQMTKNKDYNVQKGVQIGLLEITLFYKELL